MDPGAPGLSQARAFLKGSATSALIVILGLSLACSPGGGRATSTATDARAVNSAPTVDVVKAVSQKLDLTAHLPGELQPYEVVAIYPKVTGFVESVAVDRGSWVKSGQLLARLVAPEITSQRAEAKAKLQGAESQRIEAEARLAADESTYQRLKGASSTPGVVSGNELELAQKTAEADRARVQALRDGAEAAKQALRSVEQIEGYLEVRAPFDGSVTERNVHPGALVGPGGGAAMTVPLLRIEKVSRLRLVVPVPEAYVAGIPQGTKVSFAVTAFPGETFSGTVARVAHSVDVKTRTMPVELDVSNPSARLAPGMFAEVLWPVRRPEPSLFVSSSAIVRTTERTFVIRVRHDKVEWVDVKTGATSGRLTEVFGNLQADDQVAVRGTDELRPGTFVTPRLVPTG